MRKLATLLFALSLPLGGCAGLDDEADGAEPEVNDLEDGLSNLGKADELGSGIRVARFGITLRHAAARTLYNLLDDNGARVLHLERQPRSSDLWHWLHHQRRLDLLSNARRL